MNNKKLFQWREAILSSDLPPTMRLVLMVISTHMNLNGGSAFPSQVTISKEAGISDRWVRYCLKHAEATGWIIRSLYPNPSGQGWRRTHYGISIPEGAEVMGKVRNSTSARNDEGAEVSDVRCGTPLPTNSSSNSSTGIRTSTKSSLEYLEGAEANTGSAESQEGSSFDTSLGDKPTPPTGDSCSVIVTSDHKKTNPTDIPFWFDGDIRAYRAQMERNAARVARSQQGDANTHLTVVGRL